MQPSRVTFNAAMDLLGADTVTLAADISVRLIKTAFTPGLDAVFLTADEATFDGYLGKNCAAATRPTGTDPGSGSRVLTITPPAGGYRWESTGTTGLPQSIYGYVVAKGAASVALTGLPILGMARLDTTVTITGADQAVEIDMPALTLPITGIV